MKEKVAIITGAGIGIGFAIGYFLGMVVWVLKKIVMMYKVFFSWYTQKDLNISVTRD